MFARPEIGTNVRVTTDWSDFHNGCVEHLRIIRKTNVTVGQVIFSQDHDDPNSFRVRVDNPLIDLGGNPINPISCVPLRRTIEIIDLDSNEELDGAAWSDTVKNKTWTVSGSKGKEYTVTVKDENWTCTCPGFGFRRQCKHINAKKEAEK